MPIEATPPSTALITQGYNAMFRSTSLGCSPVLTPSSGHAPASLAVGLGIWACRGMQEACIMVASLTDVVSPPQGLVAAVAAGRRAVQRLLSEMQ